MAKPLSCIEASQMFLAQLLSHTKPSRAATVKPIYFLILSIKKPASTTVGLGPILCPLNNRYNESATQFGSLSLHLFHVIQLKQNHYLDFTRAAAVPDVNPIDTRVRVLNISGSKLPDLFTSGHSERCWAGNSSGGDCYVGWRKSMANDAIIWHALQLQTLSE
jgi:hypothetical protein